MNLDESTDALKMDWTNDKVFNDDLIVNINPDRDPDITMSGEWTQEQLREYRKTKERANMRELIIYVRQQKYYARKKAKRDKELRQIEEQERKEVKRKEEERRKNFKWKIIGAFLGAIAALFGTALASQLLLQWFGVTT